MKPEQLYFCQSDYGLANSQSHQMFWTGGLRKDSIHRGNLSLVQFSTSYSAGNTFLASALNAQEDGIPVTHIGMMHNDIVPEQGWIDILMEDLLSSGADVISAVVPIKDSLGLTSTAIDSDEDPYEVERRLTMAEVCQLPMIFNNEDCGYPNNKLLVNTGCFVMNFTKEWRYGICFDASDKLVRGQSGKWESRHSPSDWKFSRDVQNAGGKVMATRRLRVYHVGDKFYSNQEPIGDWKTDEALGYKFNRMPILV